MWLRVADCYRKNPFSRYTPRCWSGSKKWPMFAKIGWFLFRLSRRTLTSTVVSPGIYRESAPLSPPPPPWIPTLPPTRWLSSKCPVTVTCKMDFAYFALALLAVTPWLCCSPGSKSWPFMTLATSFKSIRLSLARLEGDDRAMAPKVSGQNIHRVS